MATPIDPARVSMLMRTTQATSLISRQQSELLKVQTQLSTGRRLLAPSDNPGEAALALQLRKALQLRTAYADNLRQAGNHLGEVDSALSEMNGLLAQAQSIASANVSSTTTAEQRSAAAEVVAAIQSQVLSLANKQVGGVYIFGGARSNTPPFAGELGGIRFVGSRQALGNVVDEGMALAFMVDADAVFGALSTRVQGIADLTPAISPDTRLADLGGAGGQGVRLGTIRIGNGTDNALVDLAGADTVADVIGRINGAGLGGVTAGISADGMGIALSGGPGEDLTVQEVGASTSAADLGILRTTGAGAGVDIQGQSLQAKVTALTPLALLRGGAGIDTASGLIIKNGERSATIKFASAITVEDMLNQLNAAGVGVRAEINATANGINILNEVQGSLMSIAENGGSTAEDLGVRSFRPQTDLVDLNLGLGVQTVDGDDLRIRRGDGSHFDVDISGLGNVQDVIDAINTASGDARVTASFATTGNGIVLTDTTGDPVVSPLNASGAAAALGLLGAGQAGVLQSSDTHPVKTTGVFSNLLSLRQALQQNDQTEITRAAEAMLGDVERVARTQGHTGARMQEIIARSERLEDQNIATTALLSTLEDTDFTEALTRFQTLQTALQATLQTSSSLLNLSLLDFLS